VKGWTAKRRCPRFGGTLGRADRTSTSCLALASVTRATLHYIAADAMAEQLIPGQSKAGINFIYISNTSAEIHPSTAASVLH